MNKNFVWTAFSAENFFNFIFKNKCVPITFQNQISSYRELRNAIQKSPGTVMAYSMKYIVIYSLNTSHTKKKRNNRGKKLRVTNRCQNCDGKLVRTMYTSSERGVDSWMGIENWNIMCFVVESARLLHTDFIVTDFALTMPLMNANTNAGFNSIIHYNDTINELSLTTRICRINTSVVSSVSQW